MGWSKSLRHKADLARRLSRRDWGGLAEAWWGLMYFHLALRWLSFERLNGSISATPEEVRGEGGHLNEAIRLQRLVGYAARLHLSSMTCLDRAFTLRWILARRGIPAEIRIGAYKSVAEMNAHAWVEVEGRAVGEAQDPAGRFKVLAPK
jgi:hypothetical protein